MRRPIMLAVFLLTIGVSKPADACSCAGGLAVLEALAEADAVFTGEVIKLETLSRLWKLEEKEGSPSFDPDLVKDGRERLLRATFAVSKVWKGVPNDHVEVLTTVDCCTCGRGFQIATVYLVYAYDWEGVLRTSACTRGGTIEDSREDLQELPEPLVDYYRPRLLRMVGVPESMIHP